MPGLTGLQQARVGRLSDRVRANGSQGGEPRSLSFRDARSLIWSRRTAIGTFAAVLGLLTLAAYGVRGPQHHARAEIEFEVLGGARPPDSEATERLARVARDSLNDAGVRLSLAQQVEKAEATSDVLGLKSVQQILSLVPAHPAPDEAALAPRREDLIKDFPSRFTIDRTGHGLAVVATDRAAGLAESLANTLANAIVDRFNRIEPVVSPVRPEPPSAPTAAQATVPPRSEQRRATVSTDTADAKLLRQMNSEQTALRTRITALRKRAELLRRAQASGMLSRSALQSLGSLVIEKLCRQQAELRRARAKLARVLGPRHPTMSHFEQDLTAGERRIAGEVSSLAQTASRDLQDALSRETALAGSVRRLQMLADEPNLAPTIQPDEPAVVSADAAKVVPARDDASSPTRVRLAARTAAVSDRSLLAGVLTTVAAIACGLLAGSAAVLGREWLRPTVRSAAQLQAYLGLPVTGLTSRPGQGDRLESVPGSATLGELALALAPMERNNTARRVLVCQPAAADRNIASELARAADKLRRRVLFIDGSTEARDGARLRDVLAGKVPLDAALIRCPQSTVMRLAGDGSILTDESAHANVEKLLRQIDQRFDLLVLRTDPHCRGLVAAGELMQHCEECLLVVRRGRAFTAEVTDPLAELEKVGVRPTGVVLLA